MNRRKLSLLLAFTLVIVLALTATSSANAQTSESLWFVKYWNNVDMEGEPVFQSSAGRIDHDWGNSAPGPGVNVDHWSAQWTTFVDLEAGVYRVTVTSDDGVRVFFGDKHIITDWNKQAETTNVATISLRGGRYPIAVDHFDDVGRAMLRLTWQRTGPPVAGAADVAIISSGVTQPPASGSSGPWQASYYNNTSLQGSPVFTRNEASIDHNWGTGSPSSAVNVDNFSARFTNNLDLIPGSYRFRLTTDDGARLWLNNRLVIDRWVDQSAHTYDTIIDWPGGSLPVRLEYYERTHDARIQLAWMRLGAAPDTGGQPTATVTASWLNVRTGPGTANSRFETIPNGTVLTLIARNDDASWVQVILPDGRMGWVSSAWINSAYPLTNLGVG